MKYEAFFLLKDARSCFLRSVSAQDAEAVLADYIQVHKETDFLMTYPDERLMTLEEERNFLVHAEESDMEVEIGAFLDGRLVGLAGVLPIGNREKVGHRAEFGIHVEKEFWRLGIGRALANACIECARKAGYSQLELEAVADNDKALALYRSLGFLEYGRNPRGFKSRYSGWQELVLMRLELD